MRELTLTQGQIALIDDKYYEYLNQWKWYAQKHGRTYYAVRTISLGNGKRTCIQMHHEVFGIKVQLDHVDSNGCNNQLDNLREAVPLENNRNMR